MNTLTANLLYAVYISSIVIHIIALYVTVAYVIPLQIKEAKVKNGLKRLRVQMLASGITLIILSLVSIITLSIPLIINTNITKYATIFLVLIHSIGFLTFSLIKRAMYHSQYSDSSKADHVEIAKLEDARNEASK
jgi:D-alanyl-lipoteichoic acid acyltransferase DltB (MBOAT superfamily)